MTPEIAREFIALSPDTKLPLAMSSTGREVLDADGQVQLFISINVGSEANAIRLANMVVTAVNTMANYRALPNGRWVPT